MAFAVCLLESNAVAGHARTALLSAFLCLASLGVATPAPSQEPVATGFPFVVRCSMLGVEHYYYLSKVNANGIAVYISPDDLAAVVTATGTPIKVSSEGSGSCAGKTVEELRDAGLAFDLR